MLRSCLFLLACITTLACSSQDFNGVWRGRLTQSPGGCYPEYFIEIQIQHSDVQLSGTSYDYYDTTRYVKLNFNGKVNMSTKRMVLMEQRVVKYNIPRDCVPCIKTYDLTLSKENNEEVLTGSWVGLKMGTKENCPQGKVTLKRVVESAFQLEDALKLELYDNGQIDGDTISIFLNQQLIMYKKGLATKPITLNVPVLPGKDYEMIMYAENLGSIPPNTALMVVTAGKKKYEVYLSSSEQKSAAVKFRYEKK